MQSYGVIACSWGSMGRCDFEIELPQSLSIPRRALGWVTDLHLPVTWYGVDEHCNIAYFGIYAKYLGTVPTYKVHAVVLTPQNYTGETLAAELNSKLNASPRFTNVNFLCAMCQQTGQFIWR